METPILEIHEIKINYQYKDGSKAQNSVWKTLGYNDSYSANSPILPNCVADKTVVSGKMPDNDLTETVTYKSNIKSHNLTINYVYSDGTKAAERVLIKLSSNVSYIKKSPVIAGYTADKISVYGKIPDNDLTVNVMYSKIDDGSTGGNNPDNPDGSGSTDPPEKPDIGGGGVDDHFQKPDSYPGLDDMENPFKNPDSYPSLDGIENPFKNPDSYPGLDGMKDPFKKPDTYPGLDNMLNPFKNPDSYPSLDGMKDPFQKPDSYPSLESIENLFVLSDITDGKGTNAVVAYEYFKGLFE